MNLAKLLWQHARALLIGAWVAAISASLLTIVLISGIVGSVRVGSSSVPLWQYMLIAILAFISHVTASTAINNGTYRALHRIRDQLINSIAGARVESLERISAARLTSVFSDETARIIGGLVGIIALSRDVSFVLAIMTYLFWLSPTLAGLVIGVLVIGYASITPLHGVAMRRASENHKYQVQALRVLKNLIEGIKQVKLVGTASSPIVSYAREVELGLGTSGKSMSWYFSLAFAASSLIYAALLGVVAYAPLHEVVAPTVLTGFLLSVVLLIQPLMGLSSAAQTIKLGSMSLQRIISLQSELAGEIPSLFPTANRAAPETLSTVDPTQSLVKLSIENLTHSYGNDSETDFNLGPISVEASPGELIFIVGGNGSGKTTFAKLLTGLYEPKNGSISLNGFRVDESNRTWYRQHFGCVFSDYCLFDGLSGSRHDPAVDDVADLIRELRLGKVLRSGETVLTRASFCSSGERRRVALLMALREDKPILVFDEVAADQDPDCREMFYTVLLPQLKQQGKLVFVITHDNRYFDVADRILHLERGQPAFVRRVSKTEHLPAVGGRTIEAVTHANALASMKNVGEPIAAPLTL